MGLKEEQKPLLVNQGTKNSQTYSSTNYSVSSDIYLIRIKSVLRKSDHIILQDILMISPAGYPHYSPHFQEPYPLVLLRLLCNHFVELYHFGLDFFLPK